MTDSMRRIAGLVRKESRQIIRDPSSLIIAGVLPVLLLMIFSFGVSLDLRNVPIGLVIEQPTPETSSFLAALKHSRYFTVRVAHHRNEVESDLVAGRLKGVIVLPAQFSQTMGRGDSAAIQLLVDGSDPNTAGLVEVYVDGLYLNWVQQEAMAHSGLIDRPKAAPLISTDPRFWFNPDLNSQYALLPGAVGIILTLIGTLLTSLVIAREWERGTMEALLATPVSPAELLLGKIIPYFILGQLAMCLAVSITVFGLGVPFHGSVWALFFISSAYLAVMLSLGLLISTNTKNQFAASQAALISAFLPAFELSGFIFEIDSMAAPIRLLTYVLPARYFVSALQTLFLAGDVASVLVPNALVLLGMATVLFIALVRATNVRLE